VDGTDVTVRTRSGRIWPGLLSGIRSDGAVLLDGELVAGSGTARSFYSLGPRLWGAPKRAHVPVSFWAFDILWRDGTMLTADTYHARWAALEALELSGPVGGLPRYPGDDLVPLLVACRQHGVEGVVLKRLRSAYQAGERSSDWRKIKNPDWFATHGQWRRQR
jgi:bifunctional non-homologous end joining protein LigD